MVEWLIKKKKIDKSADLGEFFFVDFSFVKCVFLFHVPMKIDTFLRKQRDRAKRLLIFSGKRHIPKQNHGNRPGFRRKKLQQQQR